MGRLWNVSPPIESGTEIIAGMENDQLIALNGLGFIVVLLADIPVLRERDARKRGAGKCQAASADHATRAMTTRWTGLRPRT